MTKNLDAYSADQIVKMRLRTETGKRNVIITLLRTDFISLAYEAIGPYVEQNKPFEIRSKFPARAFDKGDSKTLAELGLAPSCALVIQSI